MHRINPSFLMHRDTVHIYTVEPVGSLEFLPIGILCVFQTVVFPVILHMA